MKKMYNPNKPRKEVIEFVNFADTWIKREKKYALDIGCGKGRHCNLLASKNYFVYGVESSKSSLELAKKVTIKNKDSIKLINCDISKFKMPKSFFDIVIDNGTLHFLDEKTKKIYYKLVPHLIKKGGLFFLMVFSYLDNTAKSDPSVKTLYSIKDIRNIFGNTFIIVSLKEKIIDVGYHKHKMVEFYGRRK